MVRGSGLVKWAGLVRQRGTAWTLDVLVGLSWLGGGEFS